MTRSAFRPHALRDHRLFESKDVDETRELISRVMQPHSLVPFGGGSGRSHMDFVKIGRLGIGTIGFGSGMHVDVEAVDGYYLLMFCVSGHAEVQAAGRTIEVNDRQGVVRAPGDSFIAKLSPQCEQLVLRIDPGALPQDTVLGAEPGGALVRFASGALRAWQQQVKLIASSPELLASACGNARVGEHVESLLVNLLTAGCTQNDAPAAATSRPGVTPGFVRRAEEIMVARLASPLQLADLAEAVGVPVRTLCDGFLRFRQTSPMHFLRQIRLERARETILATSADVRIAGIALDCGFTHFGRFAQSYRERFGELPSQTVRSR
ncbi:AraC family transcriptional regulator [bacterium M00.F.Ca.ET.228.01.1.1]|uniref:anthranilate 1,2-dioxygenase regulatory protein AndR n=2 Tax=Pseudomonadota TaxID=1224 RepID=UPI001093207C|nr:anthranilate 1,2-dioxygenase regulatory protein AndR [Paraburkholderia phenoliruptrix]TGP47352.1 AraC family transcriptional regulator [bacterium M00.F.Ca.ET.228.01.1.1]TGS05144.1 AraC family transcriptional regulator [bacterium M00.F.Ca.ET.191.01.1.1]TGU10080.1 AraC family transcriptional regulator [bacterium M00.F.Ca.ET.155.01.1.1]MBW0449651.1 AraC family transcriptional regulator [Paraburkholderia phenoliruptrix]MBW9101269.1 AraC family transcriptional regulator [Paraburkholderia phenoli